jgi:transcription elongation factor GreA
VTDTDQTEIVWLTQDAYDRLQAELADLSGPQREEIARKIGEARDEGDLKENGGYHAAKEEQGKQEARIRQLEQLLRNAKVGEAPVKDTTKVGAGMLVEVRYDADDDIETFLLGSREDHIDDYPIYSPSSPLGHALMGAEIGQSVIYTTPRGAKLSATVLSVRPYSG